MYKLFYYPRNASWALHLLLEELEVGYELVLVDRKSQEQKSTDYLQLNPTGRIPTLIDGENTLFESGAIALYLCDKHQDLGRVPNNNAGRAQCYQWLLYLTATLQPEFMMYFYPEKHTTSVSHISHIKDAQEERISKMLQILDNQIGERCFLVGNNISVCDYFLFMLCHWGSGLKKSPLGYPNLARSLRHLASRDSFKKVCSIEGTSLDKYKIV